MRLMNLAILAATLLVAACGGGASAVTCDNLPSSVTYNNQVKPFLENNCTECHSSSKTNFFARQRAPKDVDFDTYDAAKANAAKAADEVQEGKMPPENTPSDSDRCILRAWVQQGTPQ